MQTNNKAVESTKTTKVKVVNPKVAELKQLMVQVKQLRSEIAAEKGPKMNKSQVLWRSAIRKAVRQQSNNDRKAQREAKAAEKVAALQKKLEALQAKISATPNQLSAKGAAIGQTKSKVAATKK